MMKKLMFALTGIMLIGTLYAQSLPFTQIEKVPNALGPSLSGLNQKHNINILNQRQGENISSPLYNDFLLSYDAGKTVGNNNSFGWGLDLFNSVAGEAKYKTQSVGLKINYKILLAKTDSVSHRIAFGTGLNISKISISNKDLRWPSQITTGGFKPGIPDGEIMAYIYPDVNIGISYILSIKEHKIVLGATGNQVNRPSISLVGSALKANARLSYYGFADFHLSSNFSIKPQFYYTTENTFNYFLAGNTFAYHPNSNKICFELGGGIINKKPYVNAGVEISKKYCLNLSFYKTRNIMHQNLNLNFGVRI
jgi:hypothetical protein